MCKIDLKNINLKLFLEKCINQINVLRIENEDSLKVEIGIILRKLLKPKYIISFEKNILSIILIDHCIKQSPRLYKSITKFEKRIIDIYIHTKDNKEKYAIELKLPKRGNKLLNKNDATNSYVSRAVNQTLKDVSFLKSLDDTKTFKQIKGMTPFTNSAEIFVTFDRKYYENQRIKRYMDLNKLNTEECIDSIGYFGFSKNKKYPLFRKAINEKSEIIDANKEYNNIKVIYKHFCNNNLIGFVWTVKS